MMLSKRVLDDELATLLNEKISLLTGELEQTRDLLNKVNTPISYLPNESSRSLKKFHDSGVKVDENDTRQEKVALVTKHTFNTTKKHSKRHGLNVLTIGFLIIFVGTSAGFYDVFKVHSEDIPIEIKSKYVIENLRGDTIDTWKSWRLVSSTLDVNILNSKEFSDRKIDLIKEAINSEKELEVDDSLTHKGPKGFSSKYYEGWAGALKQAQKEDTIYNLPTDFDIITSSGGEGDVIITLSNLRDSDGYTGYTKSVVDGNEILKSFITIYDVNNLSSEELGTILRHEFGHALGLGHSTAPEDLMAPNIDTTYPYITECNIDAILSLYNGNDLSKTVCEV